MPGKEGKQTLRSTSDSRNARSFVGATAQSQKIREFPNERRVLECFGNTLS